MSTPDSVMVCGLPAASSVMRSEAERAPVSDGAKRTRIVHVPSIATTAPAHVSLVTQKSSTSPLATRTCEMFRGHVPLLRTTTERAGAIEPTSTEPKSASATDTTGAGVVNVLSSPALAPAGQPPQLLATIW